ncbi:MAG: hypothetical protein H6644_20820 [Caldilineaceae bacterium]|nr:hypothetical protein [Caldilineaceae bacterium]
MRWPVPPDRVQVTVESEHGGLLLLSDVVRLAWSARARSVAPGRLDA